MPHTHPFACFHAREHKLMFLLSPLHEIELVKIRHCVFFLDVRLTWSFGSARWSRPRQLLRTIRLGRLRFRLFLDFLLTVHDLPFLLALSFGWPWSAGGFRNARHRGNARPPNCRRRHFEQRLSARSADIASWRIGRSARSAHRLASLVNAWWSEAHRQPPLSSTAPLR